MKLVYENGSALQILEFDCTIRELNAGTATVTEHPVEAGVDITTGVRPSAPRLTGEVCVSNKPIRAVAGIDSVQAPIDISYQTLRRTSDVKVKMVDVRLPLPGVPTIRTDPEVTPSQWATVDAPGSMNVLQFPTPFDRVRDVYNELERIRMTSTIVYVIADLKDYPSMAITSLSAPRDLNGALTMTIEFAQINVAQLVLVEATTLEKRAEPTKPQGSKATYELEPQKESVAHAGLDAALDFVSRPSVPL